MTKCLQDKTKQLTDALKHSQETTRTIYRLYLEVNTEKKKLAKVTADHEELLQEFAEADLARGDLKDHVKKLNAKVDEKSKIIDNLNVDLA